MTYRIEEQKLVKSVLSMTRAQKRMVLLMLDIGLVPFAFLFSSIVQYSTISPGRFLFANWPIVPILMVVAVVLSLALRTADTRLKHYDVAAAQRTALFAAILAIVSALLTKLGQMSIPAGFHVNFGLVYLVLCAGSRIILLQTLLAIYRDSEAVTRVIIYGAGQTGMSLATALRARPDILPIAFVDDNPSMRGLILAGLPVFSGAHVDRILEQHRIDQVILAMPSLSTRRQSLLSSRLTKLGLGVQTLPAFAQLTGQKNIIDQLMPAQPVGLLSRKGLHDEMDAGADMYKNARILITGAGGSIGLELCRQVVACEPACVVLFELSEVALYKAEMEMNVLTDGMPVEIVPVLGSVGDGALVERSLKNHKIDVVLHAAAYKHVPLVQMNARAGVANNALATAVLAQQVRACGVGRFVLISTDKAVQPTNIMGASKRIAELVVQGEAARSSDTVFSIVRFGNVLGSSGSVIPRFQEQIAAGGPVTLTHTAVTRYFMTIQEAARLVLIAGSLAEGGEVFVLDMGPSVPIRDLAAKLIDAAGLTVRDEATPDGDIEIVVTGLRPGEKLHEQLTIGETAQSTAHPKILSVREAFLSEIELAAALRDLKEGVNADDDALLRHSVMYWAGMRNPVPAENDLEREFKPAH